MNALILDATQHIIVSDNETGIDGFIRLTTGNAAPVEGCSNLEISTLYVQPRHHGKGGGRSLLHAGLKYARTQGAASVWLATNVENTPAIAFYLGHGFVQVGQTDFLIRDRAYRNNVYRIPLYWNAASEA